jgi:hypothetical protein
MRASSFVRLATVVTACTQETLPTAPVALRLVVRASFDLSDAHLALESAERSGEIVACEPAEDGVFRVELPRSGRYVATLFAGHQRAQSACLEVPPAALAELEWVLGARRVSGCVREDDGSPVEGAVVQLGLEDAEEQDASDRDPCSMFVAWATTRADGSFEMLSVPPGAFWITATAPRPDHAPSASRTVDVGVEHDVESIELQFAAAGSLRVRVLDPSGASAREFSVWVGSEPHQRHEFVEQDDAAVFDGLAAGTHEVRAYSAFGWAHEPAHADVRAGETSEAVVHLAPAGRILVRALGSMGTPRSDVTVEMLVGEERPIVVHGSDHMEPVPIPGFPPGSIGPIEPGRVVLRAWFTDVPVEFEAWIFGGEVTEVVLRAP